MDNTLRLKKSWSKLSDLFKENVLLCSRRIRKRIILGRKKVAVIPLLGDTGAGKSSYVTVRQAMELNFPVMANIFENAIKYAGHRVIVGHSSCVSECETSENSNQEGACKHDTTYELCQNQTEEGSGDGGGDSGGDEEQGDDDPDPEWPQRKAEASEVFEQLIAPFLLITAEQIVLLSYTLLILVVAIYLPRLDGSVLGGIAKIIGVQLAFILAVYLYLRRKRTSHRRSKKSDSDT